MIFNFDQHAINHMVVALTDEMAPQGVGRHAEADTIFLGGPPPSEADKNALGMFGLRKNYKIVHAAFDEADPAAGPIGYVVVATDGLEQSVVLQGGRLWKRNRRTPSVLLFPGIRAVVKVNGKGRMTIKEMTGQYADHGYDLARDAVLERANRKPGKAPVVSPIGALVTVMDMRTFAATFAAAE